MTLEELIEKMDNYKNTNTLQSWKMDTELKYDNDYITVQRIDSSNKEGGQSIKNGKQWSIIIDLKKDFTSLKNWILLKKHYGKDLKLTPVNRGRYKNCYGIRLYKMSKDPTIDILLDLLNYIFNI